MDDKVVKIEFNLWASSEEEVVELKKEIFAFIDYFGQKGKKVTASKLTEALKKWQVNPLVRNSVINHFK